MIEVNNVDLKRLIESQETIDIIESYKFITDIAFSILPREADLSRQSLTNDCILLYDMTINKNISLLQLLDGTELINEINPDLGRKISDDRFSMMPIVRAQYEAYCIFNNILIKHDNDERKILFILWTIAGLNERQRFKRNPDNKYEDYNEMHDKYDEMKKKEQVVIDRLKADIYNTDLYKNNSQNKAVINNAIKVESGKYRYVFINGEISAETDYKELFSNSGITLKAFNMVYPFLSNDSHPSNMAVQNYKIQSKDDSHKAQPIFISRMIISFLIGDFVAAYVQVKEKYKTLPELHRTVIEIINKEMRGVSVAV